MYYTEIICKNGNETVTIEEVTENSPKTNFRLFPNGDGSVCNFEEIKYHDSFDAAHAYLKNRYGKQEYTKMCLEGSIRGDEKEEEIELED